MGLLQSDCEIEPFSKRPGCWTRLKIIRQRSFLLNRTPQSPQKVSKVGCSPQNMVVRPISTSFAHVEDDLVRRSKNIGNKNDSRSSPLSAVLSSPPSETAIVEYPSQTNAGEYLLRTLYPVPPNNTLSCGSGGFKFPRCLRTPVGAESLWERLSPHRIKPPILWERRPYPVGAEWSRIITWERISK